MKNKKLPPTDSLAATHYSISAHVQKKLPEMS